MLSGGWKQGAAVSSVFSYFLDAETLPLSQGKGDGGPSIFNCATSKIKVLYHTLELGEENKASTHLLPRSLGT